MLPGSCDNKPKGLLHFSGRGYISRCDFPAGSNYREVFLFLILLGLILVLKVSVYIAIINEELKH
jgi:hypothetical protein